MGECFMNHTTGGVGQFMSFSQCFILPSLALKYIIFRIISSIAKTQSKLPRTYWKEKNYFK